MPEPHVEALLEHGKAMRYERFRFMREVQPNRCHQNTARAWLRWRRRGFRIVTGWVLSADDGLWRQHTWGEQRGVCVESNGGPNPIRYGVRLDLGESLRFLVENLAPEELEKAGAGISVRPGE
jgi:hypothetical protein